MSQNDSMLEAFSLITDPRKNINKKYSIEQIVILTVFAVTAGCDSWVEVESYGKTKLKWLNKITPFKNGIPSHDTISRVFTLIDPLELQKLFEQWGQKKFKKKPKHIAIDGKSLKATSAEASTFSYLALISAWASEEGVCFGQVLSNLKYEKKAFQDLIASLDLKGVTVTMDANGLTSKILNTVKERKGDFLVALKKPQLALRKQVEHEFLKREADIKIFEKYEKDHGREEGRRVQVLDIGRKFNQSTKIKRERTQQEPFPEFKSCIRVLSIRKRIGTDKDFKEEARYYISSRKLRAQEAFKLVRSHWSIENNLHWNLDVNFNEDRCTVKEKRSALNFSILRRFCLSILKSDKSKNSIRVRRKIACWDDDYLLKVIKQFCQG